MQVVKTVFLRIVFKGEKIIIAKEDFASHSINLSEQLTHTLDDLLFF